MRYNRVYLHTLAYELPSERVTTLSLEERLADVYKELGLSIGIVESLTGIKERRYWPLEHRLSDHAAVAAKRALAESGIAADQLGMLIYGGVGRDQLEPATACAVANQLQLSPNAQIFDISNACLGVLNGMLMIANSIENGNIQAGLVVSAESSREIIDTMIDEIRIHKNMEHMILSLATLTGGSGAIAILLTNENFNARHRLIGAVARHDSKWHELCRWGPPTEIPSAVRNTMRTDSLAVLKHGVALGKLTYSDFMQEMPWGRSADKFICHQVGEANQKSIRELLNIPENSDFVTYPTLGNMGTVALPLTAALADKTGFIKSGEQVAWLGIGSGLNCLMLGIDW